VTRYESPFHLLSEHFAAAATDLVLGLERVLAGRWTPFSRVLLGLLLGWWVYVPLHELLHVAGCVLAGGSVHRLELGPIYGAHWLSHWFWFVEPGGEYAGRLADFDVRGKDSIYLATDLSPFVLALWPGLWLVRRAARFRSAWAFGAALPMALSPWLSWTGDAYEIGSLLVVQVPVWRESRELLVGDDLFLRFAELRAQVEAPWGGWFLSVALGTLWAASVTALGSAFATLLGQPPLGSVRAAGTLKRARAVPGEDGR
jgi:hypothetical protein